MKKRQVYFYRSYNGFQGGHLKVFDYFMHFLGNELYEPKVFFTQNSICDDDNPWQNYKDYLLKKWRPEEADLIFLAGMDWLAIPEKERRCYIKPVINLIQGFRHCDPDTILYSFLPNRAVRIAVSHEVAKAVTATGIANGPVITIPNGLEPSGFPKPKPFNSRTIDLLIVGTKMPVLAEQLESKINHVMPSVLIRNISSKIPRMTLLEMLADSKISLFLPLRREGFYLPALEGMALKTLVICPDCLGNRSHCIADFNCIRPEYSENQILESIFRSISLNDLQAREIIESAYKTSQSHNSENERSSLFSVINSIYDLYY